MSTRADVFRELNALKARGLVRDYALGGATAVLFYAEPTRTYTLLFAHQIKADIDDEH